jgi:hypothetical protein
MSNWPQRSVSASDQVWICFFGANPEVLSERTVSDMVEAPIREQAATSANASVTGRYI